MVFVYLEGYAVGAPSYTTCPDANGNTPRWSELLTRLQLASGDVPARGLPVVHLVIQAISVVETGWKRCVECSDPVQPAWRGNAGRRPSPRPHD